MTDQDILDNAPEGTTHVMGGNCYCMENTEYDYSEDGYDYLTFRNEDTSGRHRSLADIKRIVELEKENKELQECFDECYEELRLTREAVEFAPRSFEPKEQE